MNDWYIGNFGIALLLSQEPCAMSQLSLNRLNHILKYKEHTQLNACRSKITTVKYCE